MKLRFGRRVQVPQGEGAALVPLEIIYLAPITDAPDSVANRILRLVSSDWYSP